MFHGKYIYSKNLVNSSSYVFILLFFLLFYFVSFIRPIITNVPQNCLHLPKCRGKGCMKCLSITTVPHTFISMLLSCCLTLLLPQYGCIKVVFLHASTPDIVLRSIETQTNKNAVCTKKTSK